MMGGNHSVISEIIIYYPIHLVALSYLSVALSMNFFTIIDKIITNANFDTTKALNVKIDTAFIARPIQPIAFIARNSGM